VVNHTGDLARAARRRRRAAPALSAPAHTQAEATVYIDGNLAAKQFIDPGVNEIKGFKSADSWGKCVRALRRCLSHSQKPLLSVRPPRAWRAGQRVRQSQSSRVACHHRRGGAAPARAACAGP
jgi:hypothetical protein